MLGDVLRDELEENLGHFFAFTCNRDFEGAMKLGFNVQIHTLDLLLCSYRRMVTTTFLFLHTPILTYSFRIVKRTKGPAAPKKIPCPVRSPLVCRPDPAPFDITIAGANEYGAAASAKLFGVEILNEGFGTSIDDTVIEQQATFVAQTIAPLQAVGTAQMIAGA